MSPLMACCCNPCTEDCPADGEGDPCELDSWASSYNVAMSVSWDATTNGSAVSAGFEDDGETYTQITNPACHVLSPTGTGGWGFRAVQWRSPFTSGFPPTPTPDTSYSMSPTGTGCSSQSYPNEPSKWAARTSGSGLEEYSYAGLTLFHEFHCETKYPYSVWFYLYNSVRVVSRTNDSACSAPFAANDIEASVLAWSKPYTSCNKAPDDALEWSVEPPAVGTLASRSKIITGERTGSLFQNYCDMFSYCVGVNCNQRNLGGDDGTQSNINFSLQVT